MLYQTHLRVHLDNIAYNIREIRKAVGNERKIMALVKANAYGHGAVEISKLAEKVGVEWLAVATVLEGIELRDAGIRLPILKLYATFPEEVETAIDYNLTLCVCDKWILSIINEIGRRKGKKISIHLEIDTGMGRVGVLPWEIQEIIHTIKNCPNIFLEGICTHFPVSDEKDVSFTKQQISLFRKLVYEIEMALNYKIPLVHCANSGGILGHPDSWMDMVRPGIMIYGYYPSPETPRTIPLKPGISYVSRVSFLKKVAPGTSISYGRTWTASEESWIATVPVGYADGFSRHFSNCGRILINGKSYPVVGRVCMDQTMVNLGPSTDVKVGDEAVLIGQSGKEEITIYEWAEKLQTITYEITCQISPRVKRYYIGSDTFNHLY